mmetsp:Transcript_6601/g.19039  ORF Transcript_6601/g.19039 Transcript_6601/m.19039 type:complete len:200 (-) Transcript_6601:557-1156(-)
MVGPLRANMGAAMAPRPMASMRSDCWSPPLSASARPSANDAIMLPITILMTSFILAPRPTSVPRKNDFLPMTSNNGPASSKSSLSPAVRKMRVPCSAGPLEPDTGASMYRPPAPRMAAAIFCAVPTSMVDTSTYPLPSDMPAEAPSGPAATSRAAAGSATQAMVMSLACATALALLATSAPSSLSGSHLAVFRFQTVTV